MPSFSRNPFPRRFGGGKRAFEIEHEALLDTLAPGWDISPESALYAECYAQALAVSMIWIANKRLSNQMIPEKMLEMLTTWEESCRLRPTAKDSMQARRRAVAAKLRGLVGNALSDIYDASAALLGRAFDGLATVGEDVATTYWPGINPGPPGYEWSSNRARIAVRMKKDQLTDPEFFELRAKVVAMLDALAPDWMTFEVGVGSEFIVNQGIVGQTII
jgi:hypothetical protein